MTLSVWRMTGVKSDGDDLYFMKYFFRGWMFSLCLALLGCGGGGGGSAGSGGTSAGSYPASIERASSYEFKLAFPMADPQIWSSDVAGFPITDVNTRNTLTFGDFLWEGTGGVAGFVKLNATTGNGKAIIFKKQAGAWVVVKSFDLDALLPGFACNSASRAVTADLNNDKRHDVFVTCKGSGAAEHQLLFLSGATPEAYQVTVLKDASGTALRYQAQQASVADLDGDGVMDIVLTDRSSNIKFLLGSASASLTDRRFTVANDRLYYTSTTPLVTLPTSEIHGVELIPHPTATRRFDLVLMSSVSNGRPTWLVKGVADAATKNTIFYAAQAEYFPFTNTSSPGEAVDVLHDGTYGSGSYYLNLQNAARTTMEIVRVPDNLSVPITVLPAKTFAGGTSAQLVFTSDAKVTVLDGDCAEVVATNVDSRCSVNATK